MAIGMPFSLLLLQYGEHIHQAFGHVAYHVGSSLDPANRNNWRDVDVRLMLPDEEYEARGYGAVSGYPQNSHSNGCWVSTVLAWSSFGKILTGLAIDFQIQPTSWANEKESKPRSALHDLARAQDNSELIDRVLENERGRAKRILARNGFADTLIYTLLAGEAKDDD